MPSTTRHAFPSPASTNVPDVPTYIKNLADAVDLQTPWVSSTTPAHSNGLIWRHPTTGLVQISDGSTWWPVSTGQIVGAKRRTTNAANTSGTTELSFLDHTVNLLASSAYRIEVFVPWTPDNVGDLYVFRLRQTTVAGTVVMQSMAKKVEGILPYDHYLSALYITTSAEASKVFHATAARIGSGGTCRADAGTHMIVTYEGPSSQVASV